MKASHDLILSFADFIYAMDRREVECVVNTARAMELARVDPRLGASLIACLDLLLIVSVAGGFLAAFGVHWICLPLGIAASCLASSAKTRVVRWKVMQRSLEDGELYWRLLTSGALIVRPFGLEVEAFPFPNANEAAKSSDSFAGALGGVALILFILGFFVYGGFQIYIGYLGIQHHLGNGWAVGALLIAMFARFTLPITIGAFFGAMSVWGWPWYGAAAFAAPGLAYLLLLGVFFAPFAAADKAREIHRGY